MGNTITSSTIRYVGVQAPNREELVKTLEAFRQTYVTDPDAAWLAINAACGNTRVYQAESDIPSTSVPCDCGADCWFIKYTEEA